MSEEWSSSGESKNDQEDTGGRSPREKDSKDKDKDKEDCKSITDFLYWKV